MNIFEDIVVELRTKQGISSCSRQRRCRYKTKPASLDSAHRFNASVAASSVFAAMVSNRLCASLLTVVINIMTSSSLGVNRWTPAYK